MIKKIALACAITLLVGCTPTTPEEEAARKVKWNAYYQEDIKKNIIPICLNDATYLYHQNGNASSLTVALGADSKIIPCKEVEQ